MYNWRLLLLAFFAVFQPIASFTERNLVDGRQQCCDHRLERDSSYSLYGNSRLKLPSEDRRITSQRREVREVRRDERRLEISPISRLAIDSRRDFKGRENRNTLELATRSPSIELRREREWESRFEVRNDFASEGRASLARADIRNTRTDRIRIEANRRNFSRDVFSQNSRLQVIRQSNFRAPQDVRENVVRVAVGRVSSSRAVRNTQMSVDENQRSSDTRETRGDARRERDIERNLKTERPNLQNNGIENERRVLRSSLKINQRFERSFDRLSRLTNEVRRFSLERVRIVDQERNARLQTRDARRNDNERRSMEIRVRERAAVDRTMTTRSSRSAEQIDRRSVDRFVREDNEHRVSSNIGDRAYKVDKSRNIIRNGLSFRNERQIVRERDDNELRSNDAVRSVSDTRVRRDERELSAARRSISVVRYIREDNREQSKDNIRSVRVDDRSGRETNRRSETRHTEDHRANRVLARERDVDDHRRTRQVRETREQSREIVRDRFEARISNSERNHARDNNVMQQRRDDTRREREVDDYRRSASERITRQVRDTREPSREIIGDRFETRIINSQLYRARESDVGQQSRNDNRKHENYRRTVSERSAAQARNTREQSREVVRDRYEARITDTQRYHSRNIDIQQQHRDDNRERREREVDDYKRISSERITRQARDMREQSRDIVRDRFEAGLTNSQRSRDVNDEVLLQRQDDTREDRERVQRFREIMSSERRSASLESRNYRGEKTERQMSERRARETEPFETRKPSMRMNRREIVRENQQRPESRDYRTDEAVRQMGERRLREREAFETRIHSSRMDGRDIARETNQRKTRNADLSREAVRSVDRRSRTGIDSARILATPTHEVKTENHVNEFNWQYLIYTLQGMYLCSIIMPMIMTQNQKKTKNIGWWSAFQTVIKAD